MLSVIVYMLQSSGWFPCCFDEAQVLAAIEIEIAVDEAIVIVALPESYCLGGIA